MMEKELEYQLKLIKRGTVDLVEEKELKSKIAQCLKNGSNLLVKAGFDPSTPDLHLGHTVLLKKMAHFQQLGHRVIFLIGDFTATIGDPTGKKKTRPQLTPDEVKKNAETYKEQVYKILDPDKTIIKFNSEWLDQLGSRGIIQLASKYTLARMIEREDFRTRLSTNQPLFIHELLYPLVQGYDSIALKADVELGGSDQIFNLLVGRDLMRDWGLEPQICLTVPLLVGLDGKEKMSKSLGNAVALNDTPKDMYGKVMSIPDSIMWDWLLLLTDIDESTIENKKSAVKQGILNPKKVKHELAFHITAQFYGTTVARREQEEFERIFAKKEIPENVPIYKLTENKLVEIIFSVGLAKSKSEVRRLIKQGGIKVDGEKIYDEHTKLVKRKDPYLLKIGKRKFAKIKII